MSSENNINEIMTVEQMVQAYTETFEGKMDESIFGENIQAIKDMSAQARLTASMRIVFGFLFAKVDIYTGDKHFKGTAYGPFVGIPQSLEGEIMTDNEDALYEKTDMFNIASVSAVVGAAQILFFDDQGKVLGTFTSTGFGAEVGIGSGSGKWVNA